MLSISPYPGPNRNVAGGLGGGGGGRGETRTLIRPRKYGRCEDVEAPGRLSESSGVNGSSRGSLGGRGHLRQGGQHMDK